MPREIEVSQEFVGSCDALTLATLKIWESDDTDVSHAKQDLSTIASFCFGKKLALAWPSMMHCLVYVDGVDDRVLHISMATGRVYEMTWTYNTAPCNSVDKLLEYVSRPSVWLWDS